MGLLFKQDGNVYVVTDYSQVDRTTLVKDIEQAQADVQADQVFLDQSTNALNEFDTLMGAAQTDTSPIESNVEPEAVAVPDEVTQVEATPEQTPPEHELTSLPIDAPVADTPASPVLEPTDIPVIQ